MTSESRSQDKRALVIAGPTASGKSRLALAAARAVDGVIINADSMQVYRDLAVLTARPGPVEMAQAPHRLYGTVDGATAYSVADWAAAATAEIEAAWSAGRVPILVGGTGLYFRALIDGLAQVPDIPAAVRDAVRARLERDGPAAAHAWLAELDPGMAERLAPGDRQRIGRALEVVLATGTSLADYQRSTPPGPLAGPQRAGAVTKYVLTLPRDALYARVDARLRDMLGEGALEEVAALAARRLDPDLPVMKALGVPPLMALLDGRLNRAEALARAQRDTRRYAKRQLTWLRNQFAPWPQVDAQEHGSIIKRILSEIVM